MMHDIFYELAKTVIGIMAALLLNQKPIVGPDSIASLCMSFFKNGIDRSTRHTKSELEEMTIDTADMIEEILIHSSVDKDSYSSIILCINNAIKTTDLSASAIVKLHNDPQKMAESIFANCDDTKHMSQVETEVVNRCCVFIAKTIVLTVAEHSHEFDLLNYSEIYSQFEALKKTLAEEMKHYVDTICSNRESVQGFEDQYLYTIARNHNKVELFTSKIGSSYAKQYRLDVAYIELALHSSILAQTQNVSINHLFDYGRRWLIQGDAGCGKTTLLQWLLLTVANKKTDFLDGYFPVLVTLRNVKDWQHLSLKQAMENELYSSDLKIPQGFVRTLSNTGKKLLLLVDGLDEVDEGKRNKTLQWIEKLIMDRDEWVAEKNNDKENRLRLARNNPRANSEDLRNIANEQYANEIIVVLTSRPLMDNYFEDTLSNLAIRQASVLPMTYREVCTFIDYWHNAISYGRPIDEDKILESAQSLKSKVSQCESIAKLAQTPLLCAMICALHLNKKGMLPTNRLELYDDCCQMLLGERDQMRSIQAEKFKEISYYEYEDKRRVLGDLALSMLKCDGSLLIDYADAVTHLTNRLTFIKSKSKYSYEEAERTAKLLLDYFIERGGILRWIEDKKIGFIHKTFQEYFAAYLIYLQGEWPLIMSAEQATSTNWRETILLSIAFSNKDSAEKVIQYYLAKSGNGTYCTSNIEEDSNKQFVYRILAINCASMARELTPSTATVVEQETRSIIPPSNPAHVTGLSSCGNLVVPLLSYKPQYSSFQIRNCAKVLLTVRTSQALSQMSEYLDGKSEEAYNVLNSYWWYLTDETIINSNIIPSYIRAIIEHDVAIKDGEAIVGKEAIKIFERAAPYCSLDGGDTSLYYLPKIVHSRLKNKLSRLCRVRIENHWFSSPSAAYTICKIINVFSIGKNITHLSVSYEGEDTYDEISMFCDQIGRFCNLKHLSIFGLTSESKKIFERILSSMQLDELILSIQHNK